MEFLKALFENGESLTYEQLAAKVSAAKLNVVNIADGAYVSRSKFDDKVNSLTQQVTDLNGQISQRDKDMSELQEKLTAAQADAGRLSEAQSALTNLQSKYSADQQAWQQKQQKQAYEFMIRERANGIKFSSPAAKRDFIREATGKEFKIDGESLLGYDDFTAKYKAENPGAIVEPEADPNPAPALSPAPTIVMPKTNPPAPSEKSVFGFHFNGVRPKPSEE